jgi:hypothetical protein
MIREVKVLVSSYLSAEYEAKPRGFEFDECLFKDSLLFERDFSWLRQQSTGSF